MLQAYKFGSARIGRLSRPFPSPLFPIPSHFLTLAYTVVQSVTSSVCTACGPLQKTLQLGFLCLRFSGQDIYVNQMLICCKPTKQSSLLPSSSISQKQERTLEVADDSTYLARPAPTLEEASCPCQGCRLEGCHCRLLPGGWSEVHFHPASSRIDGRAPAQGQIESVADRLSNRIIKWIYLTVQYFCV